MFVLNAPSPRPHHLALFIMLGLSLGGCTGDRRLGQDYGQWLTWHPALEDSLQKKVELSFDVEALSTGRYELSGQTQLPEGSRLAIAAIRYLKLEGSTLTPASLAPSSLAPSFLAEDSTGPTNTPVDDASSHSNTEVLSESLSKKSPEQSNALLRRLALDPSYVILDYQLTDIIDGSWSSKLNLWQVARDGQYLESWQIHQKELQLQWKPESDVIFLATLVVDGASDRLQPVQNKLAETHLVLSNTLVKTSLEGEQYFQAAKLLPIPLPTGQTTPPGLRVQDINGGWGERYLLVEQDPLPGTYQHPPNRNTNAPGSPEEFIQ